MGAQEVIHEGVWGAAADTAQALADTYAELAKPALTSEIASTWRMASEIAEDYALKARTKALSGD